MKRTVLVRCERCGGVRLVVEGAPPTPHGTHWVVRDGESIKVDCVGEEVW